MPPSPEATIRAVTATPATPPTPAAVPAVVPTVAVATSEGECSDCKASFPINALVTCHGEDCDGAEGDRFCMTCARKPRNGFSECKFCQRFPFCENCVTPSQYGDDVKCYRCVNQKVGHSCDRCDNFADFDLAFVVNDYFSRCPTCEVTICEGCRNYDVTCDCGESDDVEKEDGDEEEGEDEDGGDFDEDEEDEEGGMTVTTKAIV